MQRFFALAGWQWFVLTACLPLGLALSLAFLLRPSRLAPFLVLHRPFSDALTNPAVTAAAPRPAALVSIRTNLDIAARLQIPKGSGVLLLKRAPGEANHRVSGVIIDPP
jgi:hypothetical protein